MSEIEKLICKHCGGTGYVWPPKAYSIAEEMRMKEARLAAEKEGFTYKLDDEGWNSELTIECDGCEEQCSMEVNIQIGEDKERAFISCDKNDYTGPVHVENHPEVKEMIKELKEKNNQEQSHERD